MCTARFLSLSLAFAAVTFAGTTALDRYVAAPDSHYKYEIAKTITGQGYTAYIVDLTSQQWHGFVWRHWLTIVRPDSVKGDTGMLYINGGSVNQKLPDAPSHEYVEAALDSHSIVAGLAGVPNEPVLFPGETRPRNEDEIIAYTWVRYLKTGDETWPLNLPMTKAAIRAMDTVTAICPNVTKFVVTGASKRGWTTWLTAAVDKRVVAIEPMVIDLLNEVPSFQHQFETFGYYSAALKPYQDMGLMNLEHGPKYLALMSIVDPYGYRDRYTMPKFLINSAGDQYFLPDSSQFYFDQLPGEKYIRYVPNTKHALNGDAQQSLMAFYDAVLRAKPRPKFSWKFEKNGDIQLTSADAPSAVRLWTATDPEARDFRLDTIGPAYKETALSPEKKGIWLAHIEPPTKGWTAYFVEIDYPSGGKYPFKFTTPVRIAPDKLPYPPPKTDGKIEDLP